ncbi:hypothetical protein SERLA73DRAFT_175062 [Serpula lacrymans var. lacrymans S7.3]|uniref:Mitochondrial carrier n=2 Tax=Serpula lacrymans var. lacrymans TaxID=341189 RepID=F8PK98_SERL3|nr:uncharacterized protein SERLADRAFT_457004 [Serpula lacrymans var. lacrymans S7.9]EGO03552.1 hypothetical protein SERLA73DRAFT_175062 [Serpula lacrymans var. lacrymans S7.3]EGO29361.1 hypothetical protein SERLADRAFT_457004 [Serpula lacrymans var. lacrymans S7.9]
MESPPDALAWDSPDSGSAALRAAKDIAFGSIAGMISKVFEHPFDLTKVRLQSQVLDSTARFSGPVDCLVKTWKNEGLRGLYRGLPAPIVGAMAENASLFVSYSEMQNIIRLVNAQPLSQDLSLLQLGLAGAGAGAITSFFLTPIELVKCKMQVQMLIPTTAATTISSSHTGSGATASLSSPSIPRNLPGPISVFMNVFRTTGFRGLWLGQTATFIRETGGGAAWFASKEYVATQLMKRRAKASGTSSSKINRKDITPMESAISGACAGAAYNFALFPADSVKSAMQTEEELRPRAKGAPGATFFGTFKEMYRAQGLRGLYAGAGVTVARSIPSSAIIFLIYDGLSTRFS